MNKKADRFMPYLSFLIAGVIILVGWSNSYAGNNKLGAAGETGYSPVKTIEKNFIITECGKFYLSGDTDIYNQDAAKIKLGDIHKDILVDVKYILINEEYIATELDAKVESKKEEIPK